MRIYPSNYHQFDTKVLFSLWDHEQAGGYGCFSDEDEAVRAAGEIMARPGFYGPIPFMLLVAQTPSRTFGRMEHIKYRIELEPLAIEGRTVISMATGACLAFVPFDAPIPAE
jgi:hypothetical protein